MLFFSLSGGVVGEFFCFLVPSFKVWLDLKCSHLAPPPGGAEAALMLKSHDQKIFHVNKHSYARLCTLLILKLPKVQFQQALPVESWLFLFPPPHPLTSISVQKCQGHSWVDIKKLLHLTLTGTTDARKLFSCGAVNLCFSLINQRILLPWAKWSTAVSYPLTEKS